MHVGSSSRLVIPSYQVPVMLVDSVSMIDNIKERDFKLAFGIKPRTTNLVKIFVMTNLDSPTFQPD